jgi:integrating conjugative element protein (TIGR03749 family)
MSNSLIIIRAAMTVLVLLAARPVFAEAAPVQRIQWQQAPIAIVLRPGDERRVQFPEPVSVGLPAALEPALRTQTVNGTVYFLARAPFGSTRIQVREIDSGQIYLFDLSASIDGSDSTPVEIILDPAQSNPGQSDERHAASSFGYVGLTRFAAQQLYAPTRLLSATPGIVRVPVQQRSVALVPGDRVEAMPLVAWRAGDLFVTAVKLSNRSSQAITLDPRLLRGAWLSATFQHARLLPAGDEADTTAVYLVSAQPFAASF